MKKKITIGITDCSKYGNYEKWMAKEPGVDVIQLGYRKNNFSEIHKCTGILLTGGEDIHPRFYDKPEYLEYCDHDYMDERRDEFEWKVVEYTQKNKIPLLGICRGLQMTNICFGGSLIPDIPSFGKYEHAEFHKGKDRYHPVQIDPNSGLKKITDSPGGEVNSSHHQAADKIGKDLVACAFSEDGVVEAIERKSDEGKSFLLLVQWHPERMMDQESQLVKRIRSRFLESASSLIPQRERNGIKRKG